MIDEASKVIITGASGFLGGALLSKLKKQGVNAVGLSRRNVPGLVQLDSYMDAPCGDVLVYLSEECDRRAANQLGCNYKALTLRALDSLLQKGYKKVIYSSSAVIYGDKNSQPCKVNDSIAPSDIYSELKYESEHKILKNGGIVARFTNLYGPGMAKTNVLSEIFRQLIHSDVIALRDLNPVRDFLWIDDAVNALMRMIFSSETGIFNVGSGVGTSIEGLIKTVLEVSAQEKKEILKKVSENSIKSYLVVDITETRKKLDWQPEVNLYDGIKRIVNNFEY